MSRKEFLFVFLLLLVLTSCTSVSASSQNTDCPYKLPWSSSFGPVYVTQTINDPANFSHKPGTLEVYAIDFRLPRGTPVLAAREGILSRFHDGETGGGESKRFAKHANFVIIDHGGGVFTYYTHLQDTVFNESDIDTRKIAQGELIGHSGNTGWSSGPHLHFQVQNKGTGIGQSIPFCFEDVPGGVPKLGKSYVSQNQPVSINAEIEVEEKAALDLSDPASIARWTKDVLTNKNFGDLKQLVGPSGARILPYAVGIDFPGYNNGEEITKKFSQAIAGSPVCLGWRLDEYQLHLLFSNARLNRKVIGFDPGKTDVLQFLFIKNGAQFELVAIGPVSNYGGWEIEYETTNLSPCS